MNKPACVGSAITVIVCIKGMVSTGLSGMLLNEKPFALVTMVADPGMIEAPKSWAVAGNVFVTKTTNVPAVRLVMLIV